MIDKAKLRELCESVDTAWAAYKGSNNKEHERWYLNRLNRFRMSVDYLTVISLLDALAAANARVAEMEKDIEKNLLSYKISLTKELAIMTQRAEQAEAQCAAMRNCDNCNKWCMKQPNNSEFDTLNRMDDCKFNNLSHWELSKKIAKAALEGKP